MNEAPVTGRPAEFGLDRVDLRPYRGQRMMSFSFRMNTSHGERRDWCFSLRFGFFIAYHPLPCRTAARYERGRPPCAPKCCAGASGAL
jgi:hypothetical protein